MRPLSWLLALVLLPGCGFVFGPGPAPPVAPTPAATQASPSPTPESVVLPSRATSGRAVFRVDVSGVRPDRSAVSPLDYFALATLTYGAPDEPALELSVRGLDPEPCLAAPCGSKTEGSGASRRAVGPHPLGLVARFSGSPKGDSGKAKAGLPEESFCGEGLAYASRLPLGALVLDVSVEWDPGGVTVSTPVASARLEQGAPRVGFSRVAFPLPDRGFGRPWAREPWVAPVGSALLKDWRVVEDAQIGACPGE